MNQSCLNALCFCWYSVAVLAESASGFNWPAAVWACDVMLLKSASLCVCQFKPAVPKHRLTLCICLDQFLLVEDLCNAEQTTSCYFHSGRRHFCSSSSVIHLLLLFLKPVYTLAALQVLLDQSTKANSPLKGHERTVQYLQRLGKDQQLAQAC